MSITILLNPTIFQEHCKNSFSAESENSHKKIVDLDIFWTKLLEIIVPKLDFLLLPMVFEAAFFFHDFPYVQIFAAGAQNQVFPSRYIILARRRRKIGEFVSTKRFSYCFWSILNQFLSNFCTSNGFSQIPYVRFLISGKSYVYFCTYISWSDLRCSGFR